MSNVQKKGVDVVVAGGVPLPTPRRYAATAKGGGVGGFLGAIIGAMVFGPVGAVVCAALGAGLGAGVGAERDGLR